LSRPFPPRFSSFAHTQIRVNGKIRAREVRIIGLDNQQLGVFALHEAINMARANGVDLVEIAPNATPPVCRMVDYGKFRYEQAKKEKESKKHQHANKVKEIQLSPAINAHDFEVKLEHAIGFLCDEMKVKVTLKFRGREMAHQEFGQQVVARFLDSISPFGQPDAPPKLVGKGIVVMLSPLPRNKRAKNPRLTDGDRPPAEVREAGQAEDDGDRPVLVNSVTASLGVRLTEPVRQTSTAGAQPKGGGFVNNPFAHLEDKLGELSK
jgi:translation initiation factor IF-3